MCSVYGADSAICGIVIALVFRVDLDDRIVDVFTSTASLTLSGIDLFISN